MKDKNKKQEKKKEETKPQEDHEMTEEEKIDQALMETFPASDPPGYISKSLIDKEQHGEQHVP